MTDLPHNFVLWDLDGVACNFVAAYRQVVEETYGPQRPSNNWDFYTEWDWSHEDFHRFYLNNHAEILSIADPYPDVFWIRKAIQDLEQIGVGSEIVTHRWLGVDAHPDIYRITRRWIAEHLRLDDDHLWVVGNDDDPSEVSKAEWLLLECTGTATKRRCIAAVDDHAPNLHHMTETGLLPFPILIARPWNSPTHGLTRLDVTGACETVTLLATHLTANTESTDTHADPT